MNLKFAKLQKVIKDKIKENSSKTSMFVSNSIWLTFEKLVRRITDRFESKLSAPKDTFNQKTMLNLIYFDKPNLICYFGIKKKSIETETFHFFLYMLAYLLIYIK